MSEVEEHLAFLYAPPTRGLMWDRPKKPAPRIQLSIYAKKPEANPPCTACGGVGEVWGIDDMGAEILSPCRVCRP